MSYISCPRCTRKALSIATQCPHCGNPFDIQRTYEVPRRALREPWAVIGVVVVLLIYFAVDAVRNQPKAPLEVGMEPPPKAATKVRSSPRPAPVPAATAAAADSTLPAAGADSGSAATDVAVAESLASELQPTDTVRGLVHALVPAPDSADAPVSHLPSPVSRLLSEAPDAHGDADPAGVVPERRYATIWANVREAPRPAAPVVTVLEPGEAVLVDSLRSEWYRVVEDGRKVGYVYASLVIRQSQGP